MVRCGCNAASATTCDAIVLCVAANLGAGLRYDSVNGVLAVRLSGDAGNAASFGSDGGIYVPGPDTIPDPASGRRTIAGLPDRAFGGSATGAGSMLPFGSPESIEYAVANRLDIVNISNIALADDVSIARWDSPGNPLSNRTDNPSSIDVGLISTVTLPSLLVDAGARDTPTANTSGAPPALLSPDGGWFGFYAHSYTPMTLAQALTKLAARAVAYLPVFAAAELADYERYVAGAIDAVIQVGAQDWAMVGVSAYIQDSGGGWIVSPFADFVTDVVGAGLTPSVDLFDDNAGGFAVTPASVVATGAQWVRMLADETTGGTSLARIQEFVDAGLQVIVNVRSSRQWDVEQVYNLGVRAITADSPVYARGARGESGDLDYRKTVVIPGLLTRTMMEGSLTHQTNDGMSTPDIGWARQSAEGRNFSAGFGRVDGVGLRLSSQLLGELCPYVATPTHRIRVRFRMDPTQTTFPTGFVPKLGIFVASPTDRDIASVWTGGTPEFSPWVNGYWGYVNVGVSQQGVVTLAKLNNGVLTILDDSESFPSIVIGDWIYMSFTMNPTGLTLAVGHSTAEDDIIYTSTDTDHRGTYAFYTWEDDYAEPITNPGFAHGYSAYELFATTFPMYEDLT